ncbi:MAG TPA: DUF2950 domain-containing protein [Casimicrobiaceae bacterium]|nr:DUF2950 domain-containing protein [Casimicrobiaceae bacterium]
MTSGNVLSKANHAMRMTSTLQLIARLALAFLLALPLSASAAEQKTFATPDEALDALLAALKADDDAALVGIFGDKHKSLVVTPDRAANSETRARALAAMQTYRLLEEQGKDRRVLLIGDQAWPLPIPLVKSGERWRFATEQGEDELINRRIGANERSAIAVLRAYLDAQKDYAAKDRDGDGVLQYAQKLGSSPGKRDGLYWPADAAKGEEASPFGPLVAESAAYLKGHKAGDAYRGYHFRILTRQGKSARGGAYSYVINGRMIAGFAMVAYPAQYGDSGVMTFIVSHNGKVFEKDLGRKSAEIGAKLTAFDPGAGWKEVAAQ